MPLPVVDSNVPVLSRLAVVPVAAMLTAPPGPVIRPLLVKAPVLPALTKPKAAVFVAAMVAPLLLVRVVRLPVEATVTPTLPP